MTDRLTYKRGRRVESGEDRPKGGVFTHTCTCVCICVSVEVGRSGTGGD